jgi:hypothetical protein
MVSPEGHGLWQDCRDLRCSSGVTVVLHRFYSGGEGCTGLMVCSGEAGETDVVMVLDSDAYGVGE